MKFQVTLEGVKAEFDRVFALQFKDLELKSEVQVATMVGDLVAATPIDTGKARASWSVEKRADVYDVKNDVDYIQYLNQGTSKQAPSRFIETIALQYGTPLGTIVDVKEW